MAVLEGWPLARRGMWREVAVFAAFWLAGLVMALFLAADRPLNPLHWIELLFRPLLPLV